MAQHDFDIANQSAPNFRADLNDALEALATLSSGATAPSTTYANMLWYDTANNILKMRSEADDAWINIGYLDQSANAFRILDDTQVVNTSGTQIGILGDQATATWETGTATTESLVSPAKVKAAIDASDWTYSSVFDLSSGAGNYDLGSIPSGVNDIQIYLRGGSLSGTDNFLIQFGTGGSPTTSGYDSSSIVQLNSQGDTGSVTSSSGFIGRAATGVSTLIPTFASSAFSFSFHAHREPSSNSWLCEHKGRANSTQYIIFGFGSVSIGGTLDNVRLTRTGTNTFDAGSAWIRYR